METLNLLFKKIATDRYDFYKEIHGTAFKYFLDIVVVDRYNHDIKYYNTIIMIFLETRKSTSKLIYSYHIEKKCADSSSIDERNNIIKLANALSRKLPKFLEKNFSDELFSRDLCIELCEKLGFKKEN